MFVGSPSYWRMYVLERKTLRLLDAADTISSEHELALDSTLNMYKAGGRQRDARKYMLKGIHPR
jgi:hypothetical protein